MKKRTKWTIRIATVALALVALFALTGCRVSDMLSGSDVQSERRGPCDERERH